MSQALLFPLLPRWSGRGHAEAAPSNGLPGMGIIVRVVAP